MPHYQFQELGSPPEVEEEYMESKHHCTESGDYNTPLLPPHSDDKRWKGRTAKIVLMGLAIWGSLNILWRLWDTIAHHRGELSCRCGDSIAEARRNKCVYDPLQLGWAPPHCRDDEATDAFRHAAPAIFGHKWPYYARQDTNAPILEEQEVAQFADTGEVYFTVQAHHLAHCMFLWMKESRVSESKSIMPKKFRGSGHAEHCAHVAMINVTLDALVSVSSVSLDLDAHSNLSKKFRAMGSPRKSDLKVDKSERDFD